MHEWFTQHAWLQHAAFYLIALVWPFLLIELFTEDAPQDEESSGPG